MSNPNDITSKYYDFAYSPIKGPEITDEEIALISSITLPKSKILDIGVGTGRHLVPLSKLGFRLTGIESSQGMLNSLTGKDGENIEIINSDVFDYNFNGEKFDLIILIWNSFNEIALNDESAQRLFRIFGKLLVTGGKVLINSDDPEITDMSKVDFELNSSKDNIDYKVQWKTINYDKLENISISSEEITLSNGKKVTAEIEQRWYKKSEFETLAQDFGFKMESLEIRRNKELYLVFTLL